MRASTWKALSRFASKDEARYQLNRIERKPTGKGKTKLIATDGRRLVELEVPGAEGGNIESLPSLGFDGEGLKPISLDSIRLLSSVGNWMCPDGEFHNVSNGVRVSVGEAPPGEFPDYVHLMKEKDQTINISLNAEFLRDVCELAIALNKNNGAKRGDIVSVDLKISGPEDCVIIEYRPKLSDRTFRCAMMPVWTRDRT